MHHLRSEARGCTRKAWDQFPANPLREIQHITCRFLKKKKINLCVVLSGRGEVASPQSALRVGSNRRPQNGIKPSFSIASMCTTGRRIPASDSTNQGPGKSDLTLRLGLVGPAVLNRTRHLLAVESVRLRDQGLGVWVRGEGFDTLYEGLDSLNRPGSGRHRSVAHSNDGVRHTGPTRNPGEGPRIRAR